MRVTHGIQDSSSIVIVGLLCLIAPAVHGQTTAPTRTQIPPPASPILGASESVGGSIEPSPAVPAAFPPALTDPPASSTYPGFLERVAKSYFPDPKTSEQDAADKAAADAEPPSRRDMPDAPFGAPFPFTEHIGPIVGIRDTSVYPLMNALYNGPNADWWKANRIKVYGWVDPSVNFSTSRNSNVPLAYNIVPNKIELSQAILIFERVTDSVQTDHMDWGFKFTNLYGIDYRYTTAKGYFSDQLLKHNRLYGYDPLQMYVDLYFPKIREGMILRMGRYISPIDIEAQLSPENYLYTHSVMYTYDPYTFTGIQSILRWNRQWTSIIGVQAGNDMAPWTTSSQPNGEFLLKWVSKSGYDSLFGGVDSVGRGYFKNGHDDLQVASLAWSHKINDKAHTLTEAYYIWERSALVGGSVTGGPAYPYFTGVGPGAFLPGLSDSFGIVNYTAYKTSEKSFFVARSDILDDPRGFRTGYAGAYFEHTLGMTFHLTPWCMTRPEIRFDYTSGQKAFDNGTRREQFTFSWDIIIRF